MKQKYPDPAERQFVRVNGELTHQATVGNPELRSQINDLKNWEVRQAAINAGIDVGQKHVGSRMGLGEEQVSRQALLDQMIQKGIKPEDIPRLARPPEPGQAMRPYTKPMTTPAERTPKVAAGKSTEVVQHHELGHAIVAGMHGVGQSGIASHLHPDLYGSNAAAGAMMDRLDLTDAKGNYDPVKVAEHLDVELEIGAAGVAANYVVDGIHPSRNPGAGGDMGMANELMEAARVPLHYRQTMWDAAVNRAIEKLRPLADMIRDEATRREDNLPVEWHHSKRRVDNIVARAQRETLEAAGQQRLFDLARTGTGGGGGTAQGVAGSEGAGATVIGTPAQATAPLKRFVPPKLDFIVAVDEGGQLPRFDRIQASGTIDLDKKIKAKYPDVRGAVIIQELGRKPLGRPYEAGESPLRGMVSDEDAEGVMRRKQAREEETGAPKNVPIIYTDAGGTKKFWGPLSNDQYKEKFEQQMTPEEISRWRQWYPEVGRRFREWFGEGQQSARKMSAWLVSQKNVTPARGLMDVMRTEDIMKGQPRIKSPGLSEEPIRAMLAGKEPTGGVGAKLHDFVDAAYDRPTRTWTGDHPEGGQPAPIDIHAGRGSGYVDNTVQQAIAKDFQALGQRPPQTIEDLGNGVTPTQYERGSERYNALAEAFNRDNYMGGGWDAKQAQAVDWAATGRQLGRKMDLPAAIFDQNLRRLAYEVNPHPDSPLGQLIDWSKLDHDQAMAVTRDVGDQVMNIVAKEAGARIAKHIYGPGGWLDKGTVQIAPSGQADILSSPEAAERVANLVGHLLGQQEVILSRAMQSGNGHVFEIRQEGSAKLSEPNVVRNFMQEFMKRIPGVEGWSPVRDPDGSAGIQILKKAGKWNAGQLATMKVAAHQAAEAIGLGELDELHFEESPAEVRATVNDWSKNPNGEAYLQRLKEMGRPGLMGRIKNEYAPAVQRRLMQTYKKAIREGGG